MALVDDLKEPISAEEMERRRFLRLLGMGALGLSTLGTTALTVRFMEPNVVYEEDRRYVVGRPEDMQPGTVVVLAKQRVYVVRTDEGFFAMTSVCAHLGCVTRYEKERSGFVCPCHGSQYALDGHVTAGPAPRGLARLQLTVDRGMLVVDAAKTVSGDSILRVTT